MAIDLDTWGKKDVSTRLHVLAQIRVEKDIVSLNRLLRMNTSRGHRVPLGSMVKEWRTRIQAAQILQLGTSWMELINVTAPHPTRRLEIVRRCKKKMDTDNAYGGAKILVDALKSVPERLGGKIVHRVPGWFYDDCPKYLDLHLSQIVTGEKPWLDLTLYGPSAEK